MFGGFGDSGFGMVWAVLVAEEDMLSAPDGVRFEFWRSVWTNNF